jgi:hypothetical protein
MLDCFCSAGFPERPSEHAAIYGEKSAQGGSSLDIHLLKVRHPVTATLFLLLIQYFEISKTIKYIYIYIYKFNSNISK